MSRLAVLGLALACLALGCTGHGAAGPVGGGEEPGRLWAEFAARHGLAPALGPFRYVCDDAARSEITATYFSTEPAAMLAVRGGQSLVLFQGISGSGARYEAGGREFWEHHGEALVTWEPGGTPMTCQVER